MDNEELFKEVVRTMSKWSPAGEKLLTNGVRLICPTPHIAPEAWLHVLYPPLASEEIEEMEGRLEALLPGDFKRFLLHANGLQMFSYRISVWGVRKSMARTGDDAWQPYDLVEHNAHFERPNGSPEDVVFFAGADNGETWCFFDFGGEGYRVGKTARHDFDPDAYWPDFGNWLINEMKSSEILFNRKGELEARRLNQTTGW